MRNLLRTGASGALLLAIMVLGSLVLWVGIPAGWLWIGSQVQGETADLGLAILVMFSGVLVSVVALAAVLSWLNHQHQRLREARGLRPTPVLEQVLVVTAAVAVVGFTIWFFGFAGIGPTIAPN